MKFTFLHEQELNLTVIQLFTNVYEILWKLDCNVLIEFFVSVVVTTDLKSEAVFKFNDMISIKKPFSLQ